MKRHSRLGLLLLLVAAVGWFALVRGQVERFGQTHLESRVRKVEADSYQARVENIDQIIKGGGQAARAKLDAYFVAIPRQSQIPEVLVMIEQLGNSAGVVFSSAGVGSPSNGEVPVSLVFTGQLPVVQAFLDTLYDNVRTVVIKNQTMTSDKNGLMNVSMQVGLIYQGE